MKTALLAQQFVHYQKTGHLCLQDYPIDLEKVFEIVSKAPLKRDFWKDHPFLKKLITRELAPLAFELTKRGVLRIGCDQLIEKKFPEGQLQDFFCFQGVACIFCFSFNEEKEVLLDICDPFCVSSALPEKGYLVLFTFANGVLIENEKDAFTIQTRKLGYGYGDSLKNPHHPIIAK